MNDPRPLRDLRGEPISLASEAAPKRRRRFPWSFLIFLALLALVGAGFLIRPQETPHPGGRGGIAGLPVPVATALAQTGSMPVTLTALGTVTPLTTVTVKTQISGRLINLFFTEGQEIEAGAPLAEVDPRPYEAALKQAKGQLARDQAQLKNAQLDLNRYTQLVAKNAASQQQVDTQQALVQQFQGTVEMDEAQVRTAELNLEYCHITAPVTGRVGLRLVDRGNYVQAGDSTGIAVITQIKPITVLFSLPEDKVPQVLKRLNSGADLPVVVYDRNRRAALATGKLVTIDNQVDVTTGTVKLKAQFDNADEALFPSQFVNVDLLVDTLTGVTVIPSAAVQRGAPGTYVYLVHPDNTVSVRKIALGASDSSRIVVTQGLVAGDKVVVDGADKLREGAKISEPDAAAGGKPAPVAGEGSERRPRRTQESRDHGTGEVAIPATPGPASSKTAPAVPASGSADTGSATQTPATPPATPTPGTTPPAGTVPAVGPSIVPDSGPGAAPAAAQGGGAPTTQGGVK
ncbi:MAG TPA: MdtA/MuxA family multidrug efflux RND transporter periplasmic adaptor subunit [Xanthobacteraceae bacterium]|jgi:multidrug efflux system membrane fusion protein|nr:MdtA/MuxA family multidrug efflux RND transporter periplasmic adaptor subunit [Xanthobacteraceae bacterium]HQS46220.1 MdtA/MuxA family multidrug efflux RND transporter periplasmic adaptor subunit [Xanthobacteraceae bacterium]